MALAGIATVAAITQTPRSPVAADRHEAQVTIEASVVSVLMVQPSQLNLKWAEPDTLLWPGPVGIVTEIAVRPGTVVRSGTIVASVDGSGVVALGTASPLYRNLSRRSRGADVRDLAEGLQQLGYLAAKDVDDYYSFEVGEAVRAFNALRGVKSNAFTASHAIWLPAPFEIGRLEDLRVGATAPPTGSQPLVGLITLAEAQVVTADFDLAGPGQSLSFNDDMARVVVVDDVGYPIDNDGRVTDLPSLQDQVVVGEDMVSRVVTQLIEPLVAYEIPASALLTNTVGQFCVVASNGTELPVEVVDGRAGSVRISDALPGPIIANPVRAGVAVTCSG